MIFKHLDGDPLCRTTHIAIENELDKLLLKIEQFSV